MFNKAHKLQIIIFILLIILCDNFFLRIISTIGLLIVINLEVLTPYCVNIRSKYSKIIEVLKDTNVIKSSTVEDIVTTNIKTFTKSPQSLDKDSSADTSSITSDPYDITTI